ncbi:MAG: glycosyltransferase family 39 protein, partial [Acidobacteria bacterium]|nr:glycosyltransferase family 39 protein [Acidobacteriota bacterium]
MRRSQAVTAYTGKVRLAAGIALLCFLLLSFSALNDFGLLGPDEPRYVSIGREMARSGDWVTPRLWGEAWFEKPVLLYWMVAAGHVTGLPGEWAARLPVALLSAAFLVLFWRLVDEQAGPRAAWMAATILATSAGWTSFSRLAVTDLPLSACFAAGMLLAAEWAHSGSRRRLPLAGVCFGLALLAKGPLAGVLALPLVWTSGRRWRDWWRVAFPALLVAGPWYALCAARNGPAFVNEFFLKHNLGRFASSDLQHVQPFWFYVPVLLLGLFPWTPVVAVLRRPANPWERLLWMWLGFGFVFFSLSVNKLPGYLLPLLP